MIGRYWIDDWNAIIRDVIFEDEELKALMKLPKDVSLLEFVDEYFVRAGYTTKLLTDQTVRIVYGETRSSETRNPKVNKQELSFDIYVKLKDVRNAEKDRLVMRTHLIANRLINILTRKRYLGGYRFWVTGQCEMGTSTIGYTRYNVTFNFLKSY